MPLRRSLSFHVLIALALPLGAGGQASRLGNEFQVNNVATQRKTPMRERRSSALFYVLAVLALPSSALAQKSPLGNEFHVNTFTSFGQSLPSVAADADGDFVVTWESLTQDGYSFGVFARRFSSAGAPLATEFQVNTFTNAGQRFPSVAADADGDFVVAWHSAGQDGSGLGVFAQRYSAAGAELGGEFRVNTFTTGNQSSPAVAMDADGDFLISWTSFELDGSDRYVRRYSAADVADLAGEFGAEADAAHGGGLGAAAVLLGVA